MRSLRSKLIIAFLLVSLVIISLGAFFSRWNTSNAFRRYVFDRNQENFISLLGDYYDQRGSWEGVQELIPRGPMPMPMGQGMMSPVGDIVLLDARFNVLIGGRGFHIGDRLPQSQQIDAIPVESNDRVVGYVVLRSDTFREQPWETAFLERLTQTLFIGSIAIVSIAVVLGLFLARSLTNPLQQLTKATRMVAAGNLDVTVDVSSQDELGELAQAFNTMNQKLAEARDLRRQMTADIAHELRTPVSVILGYADGLKENVIPPTEETFDLIQEQAEQLEHLIEDLRTLTRAEAGELALDLAPTDPVPLVKRLISAYEPQAVRQEVTLTLDVIEPVPQIFIDTDRVRQILSNLIANALQYTPAEGHINIHVASTNEEVEFTITDSGPGISEEDLDRIFERFYRRDQSRSRDTGGSGLGLSIAKSLVERQGGRIAVESQPGKGSSFHVAFPHYDPTQ